MMANTFSAEVRSNEIRSAPHDYRDSGFEVFNNPPSMWPSFLVGQRDSPIRALVIDDDIHFVNVLQQELSQDERIQVVGKANSLKEGKRLCRSASFDVLLFDINLADGSATNCWSFCRPTDLPCKASSAPYQTKTIWSAEPLIWGLPAICSNTLGLATIRNLFCKSPMVGQQ